MTVYANNLEIACKKQSNKVIATFPDVCFTPPQTPATPPGVPVPYPNFGLDGDTDKGTGTVKIGGGTITHKNKSYYTRSSGDEAGCAPKKGIISSKNTGKEYGIAWSSNVKADGEPVSRFSDLATMNHGSVTNGPPNVRAATPATPPPPKCDPHKPKTEEVPNTRPAEIAQCDADIAAAKADQAAPTAELARLQGILDQKNVKLRPPDLRSNVKITAEMTKQQRALGSAQNREQIATNDRRGLANEEKVSSDVGGSKCIKIFCEKCNETLQELDVVVADGRVKEVKSSEGGYDEDKFNDKKKFVETDQLLGPGHTCKLAVVGGVSADFLTDHPELAGRTQNH